MHLLDDIRRQSHAVRMTLWALASFIALSAVGYLAFTDLERSMFMALHDDPEAREEFLAHQRERGPQPLAAISGAVGELSASIGSLIGFDSGAGFEREKPERDAIYLLPLSK